MPGEDSFKLPYFRFADRERAAFLNCGFNLLETAMEGRLPDWFGLASAQGLCDMVGSASIVPHDLRLTVEEQEISIENSDTFTELHSDALTRQQEFFVTLKTATRGWHEHGIGLFRTIYYAHALTITAFDNKDRMRIGGFRPPVNPYTPSRLYKYRGQYALPTETKDWLSYDAYLSDILAILKVPWTGLESAILAAFVQSLPAPYRKLLQGSNVPEPLIPVLWRHDIEHFHRVNRYGEKAVEQAKKLNALITKIGLSDDYTTYLERLEQAVKPPAWAIRHGGVLPELLEHTQHNPPTLKASYKALADTLGNCIEHGFRRGGLPTGTPDFVHRIYDGVAAGGQRPAEFWKLCADIVYHLPLLISRVPKYTASGDLIPPTFPTFEGFRSVVRDRSTS